MKKEEADRKEASRREEAGPASADGFEKPENLGGLA